MLQKQRKGTVVQIRGRFYARWTVEGKRLYGNPRDSFEEADNDRISNAPLDKPQVLKSRVPTLNDFAKARLGGEYGKAIAGSTFAVVESIRRHHIEDSVFGDKRLNKITRADCRDFMNGLSKSVKVEKHREKHPISPVHWNRIFGFLSSLFTQAMDAGLIKSNPIKGLKLKPVPERENRTLSPQEAMKLLNPTTTVEALMLVAMHTGMRRSELLRLEWRHVGSETIKVPGTKSARSKAVLPLTQEAREAIMQQPRRSVFVFTTEDGSSYPVRKLADDVADRKKALGLPAEMRLHDLRGSYISLLIEQGADPRTVMELARHSDLRTTMKAYARSRQSVQKAAVDGLRNLIVPNPSADIQGAEG